MKVFALFITAIFTSTGDFPEKDTVMVAVFNTEEQCEKAKPWLGVAANNKAIVLRKYCAEVEVR